MFRKITSMTLLVSLLAVGISGLCMIFLGSFEFQLRMHPIHKVFGLIMCISGLAHIALNLKPIKSYLKISKVAITTALLIAFSMLLLAAGMKKPIDNDVVHEIENNMQQLKQGR